jgi:hypothetical protein
MIKHQIIHLEQWINAIDYKIDNNIIEDFNNLMNIV